jgi:hypothetical protein
MLFDKCMKKILIQLKKISILVLKIVFEISRNFQTKINQAIPSKRSILKKKW